MLQTDSSERGAVIRWFETDFKDTARSTTQSARLDNGKVSYKFSAVNNSGFSFRSFSFRVKIIDKATGSEIGSATINAGDWAEGDRKNFKSEIPIPPEVRSISFILYPESVKYELAPDSGNVIREFTAPQQSQDPITQLFGADGNGGVFGELFGTGGMPDTQPQGQRPNTQSRPQGQRPGTQQRQQPGSRQSGGTQRSQSQGQKKPAQKTSGGPRNSSGQRSRTQAQPRGPMESFASRKTQKRLNKMRLGKSGWDMAGLVSGIIFALATMGAMIEPTDAEGAIMCGGIAAVLFIATGIHKYLLSKQAKRIRTYEAKINLNGNTSLDDLALFVGRPVDKVADDLQKMIVDGFFPEAYIDINNRLLVMTHNGEPIESVEKSAVEHKKARIKAARDKGIAPESIDDLITMTDDAEIKTKLKALRTITMKIDHRIEERPELAPQVKEFREKFYPEVVRLTDEYNEEIANLDSSAYERTPAEGEINANPNYLREEARKIKDQLIKLIDSVTEASENLLEKLHEDDLMDISTDIAMLQTTLASKGLLDSDFDL